MRLGQARTPGERGPLLAEGVLDAAGVEIDEAEIAPDLRAVGVKSLGGFELGHGLGQSALPVEREPAPRALHRLPALDRRRHGPGDVGLSLWLARAAISVDKQWVDGHEAGVHSPRPLQRADGVARSAGSDQSRAEPVERERVLLYRDGVFVGENGACRVALLLPCQRLPLQDLEAALGIANAGEGLECRVGPAVLKQREPE